MLLAMWLGLLWKEHLSGPTVALESQAAKDYCYGIWLKMIQLGIRWPIWKKRPGPVQQSYSSCCYEYRVLGVVKGCGDFWNPASSCWQIILILINIWVLCLVLPGFGQNIPALDTAHICSSLWIVFTIFQLSVWWSWSVGFCQSCILFCLSPLQQ